jgi:small subunit ribosomal protein S16
MVKIRLMRVGKKKQPSFRVVVADSRSPRDGRIIETIGNYQPREDPSVITIDNERALHWLQRGAQPSDPVRKLLRISGAWADFTGKSETLEAPSPKKATPAASVATPAASVEETPEPTEEEAVADANADDAEQEMPSEASPAPASDEATEDAAEPDAAPAE